MRKLTRKLPLLCTLLLLALLAPALPWPARAQQSVPQQDKPQDTIRVGVNLVSLYVTVRDKNKRILPDLTQADFEILEDGQPQKIDSFAREVNLPLTFGMLIDTSISQMHVLPMEQDAADRFLGRVLRPKDLAFVFSFDLNVDLLGDFTSQHRELIAAIGRARINGAATPAMVQGPVEQRPTGTKMYDAIYLACREKLASEAGRKALILLTDALDFGSDVSLEDALETAQRTDTVIHVIGVADYAFYGGMGFGYSGEGYARKLAEQTGGRSIFVRNEKKLEEAFSQISEELRTQYVLGYYSTNRSKDGKFRKVEIKLKRNDAKALARRGYYAPRQ